MTIKYYNYLIHKSTMNIRPIRNHNFIERENGHLWIFGASIYSGGSWTDYPKRIYKSENEGTSWVLKHTVTYDITFTFYDRVNLEVHFVTTGDWRYIDLSDDSNNLVTGFISSDDDMSWDVIFLDSMNLVYTKDHLSGPSINQTAILFVRSGSSDAFLIGLWTNRTHRQSQTTNVSGTGYLLWRWSDENVEIWAYDESAGTLDTNVKDCGINTEIPPVKQHAITYDDLDILSFVLAEGIKEISTIVAVAQASITDETYLGYSAIEKDGDGNPTQKDYWIWFDKAGDGTWSADPGGRTNIKVDISGDITAQDVSDSITAAINAITIIKAENGGGTLTTVTIANHYNGNVTDIADVDSGLSVATSTQGVDNKFYYYTYEISSDTLTKGGEYNIALMLDRNTDSDAIIPFNLEKGYNILTPDIYQIRRGRIRLNYIAYIGASGVGIIYAISDTYLIDANGDMYKYQDRSSEIVRLIAPEHFERDFPKWQIEVLETLNEYLQRDMIIQLIDYYSEATQDILYLAVYNFKDDSIGGDPAGWVVGEGGGTVNVVENVFKLKRAVELYDTNGADVVTMDKSISTQTYGTMEWYWVTDDASKRSNMWLRNSTDIVVHLDIDDGKFRYWTPSIFEIATALSNTLYRLTVDFERTVGGYQGLAQNKWQITIEIVSTGASTTYGPFDFRNNLDIDNISFRSRPTDSNYKQWVGAVGYSWSSGYVRGDNAYREQGEPDQIVLEGYIDERDLWANAILTMVSLSEELYNVYPNVDQDFDTSYISTYYDNKKSGALVKQLISDYLDYTIEGTIQDGLITWQYPDDIKFDGNKNLITIFNRLADAEGFSWATHPTGALDFTDSTLNTKARIQSTSNYDSVRGQEISQKINQVKIWGGLVNGVRIGPKFANDADRQSIHGIIKWEKKYTNIFNETDLQTIANNKLTLFEGLGPLVVDIKYVYELIGFIQPGQTIFIDENISIEHSRKTITSGVYIINGDSYLGRRQKIDLKLSDGQLFKEDQNESIAEENTQDIDNLAYSQSIARSINSIDTFIEKNQRNLDEHLYGFLSEVSLAESISSGSPVNVTNGIARIFLVIIAGSDTSGTITITGTTVDRVTGTETGSDTENILIDGLSTDNSDTDTEGNTRWAFVDAYITEKWFKGAITLSTTDVNISDFDIYTIVYEQANDDPYAEIATWDWTFIATNTAAWLYTYLYKVAPAETGNKCTVSREVSLELSAADSEANSAYRLRRGNLNIKIDGSREGFFADIFFGPIATTYFIDLNIKLWVFNKLDFSFNE